jgi:alpha-L-fucosidase
LQGIAREIARCERCVFSITIPYLVCGTVLISGLKNKINRVWVLGNGTKLEAKVMMKMYRSAIPGLVYIDVPERVLDPQVTVPAVLLDGPIDLFHEK